MDNEKWPAFITGFVLGILVAGGVAGAFAWQQRQQLLAVRERARASEEMAHQRAEELAQRMERARESERKARKALDEALNNIKLKERQPGDKADK
jgi:uncharacterized protein HemX